MGFQLAPSNLTLDNPEGQRSTSGCFDSKYLQNGDRYKVGHHEALVGRHLWLSIGTIRFEGSKIKVILFDVKYVKNGKSYDVGPNRDYIECPWASLCLRG